MSATWFIMLCGVLAILTIILTSVWLLVLADKFLTASFTAMALPNPKKTYEREDGDQIRED